MAISLSNNPFGFNNPFTNNTLSNLKPHIRQNNEESNAKEAEANEKKVRTNSENKETETIKNPLDALKSSLTSKVLSGLLNFGLQNAKNNMANLQNLRRLPDEMKPKEEQIHSPTPTFKDPLDTLREVTKKDTREPDLDLLGKLKFLNGDRLGEGIKEGEFGLVAASSIEVRESITYTISYDSASGQYSQSISYSSSLVANFDSEITDKNGNTFISKTQLVMGKSLESQITGGVESINDTLKEFLEGQKFTLDYDGELDEESFKNSGLDNMLLIIDSKNNVIANAFNEILSQKNDFGRIYGREDKELVSLFETLHNVLNSSLEIFLGIAQNQNNMNDNNSKNMFNNIASFSSKEYNFNITTAKVGIQSTDMPNEQQWKAQKVDIESLEILGYSSSSYQSSFMLNA